MVEIWYELCDPNNGQPICYLKNKSDIYNLKNNTLRYSSIETLKDEPNHLEFIVKDDGKIKGSFEFELHAMKYNLEKLNGKGEIHPNLQTGQLKLDL